MFLYLLYSEYYAFLLNFTDFFGVLWVATNFYKLSNDQALNINVQILSSKKLAYSAVHNQDRCVYYF